jgi:hypothetical protein
MQRGHLGNLSSRSKPLRKTNARLPSRVWSSIRPARSLSSPIRFSMA